MLNNFTCEGGVFAAQWSKVGKTTDWTECSLMQYNETHVHEIIEMQDSAFTMITQVVSCNKP